MAASVDRSVADTVTPLSLNLPSFAKINWGLQVLGKRPDGYHEVRTILQTISLHDDLHFELSEDRQLELSCSDPGIPADRRNLVVRAAYALKNRYKIDPGARIRLEKRIPAQAGLGGASSNAAVTLLALTHMWKVETTLSELVELASTLGSDVPFFLWGGSALATGTGASVFPLADSEIRYLIVIKPNTSVATANAYAALSSSALTTMKSPPILSSSHTGANLINSVPWPPDGNLNNDFESVIFDNEPEIRRCKEALLQAGALAASMAGSGSSVFGIFANPETRQRAVAHIKDETGWRIFSCDTVSRSEYVRALASCDVPFLQSFNSGPDTGA
ncbi:MAG: 4-(cytidine 5'-diphospho)-2-C-methyl-D-erythritol kinase [Pyrinomonadaceae bacterium]